MNIHNGNASGSNPPEMPEDFCEIVTGGENARDGTERMVTARNGSNSADSAMGEGNTSPPPRQGNPLRYACFTLNNYTDAEQLQLASRFADLADKWIIGKEVGTSGTPHLQGAVHFRERLRPITAIGIKRIHWEKMKGTWAEATKYCAKDGDYTALGVQIAEELRLITPRPGWQVEIMDLISGRPHDRQIYWYVDQEGGKGKSALTKLLCAKYAAICMAGKAADMKCGMVGVKKDTGVGPRIVILDCPRTQDLNYISYQGIEEIKNGCFFSSKYESGMYIDNPPHVIIFSNHFPDELKLTQDRWVIKEI